MQKVTDSFELPKDIVLGLPIVTAYGYNELTIENHKGILSFSDKAVTAVCDTTCTTRKYQKNTRQPP